MEIKGVAPAIAGNFNPKVYTFPSPFIDIPIVINSAVCFDIATSTYIGYVDTITKNSFRYVVKSSTGEAKLEGINYIATGKWK